MPEVENFSEDLIDQPIYRIAEAHEQEWISLHSRTHAWNVVKLGTPWQQVGAATVRLDPILLEFLERSYTVRRRSEVLQFLSTNSFLVTLLLEVYARIEDYFGHHPHVVLEVVTDPEAEEEEKEFFAFIQTSLSPKEALERLDKFDKEWWLRAMDRGQGKLCIDVEFL
ncbi:hypothetical protein IIA15_00150 [candidate division TA06 bacterium]|nr:hypothetical protein [candidate division TA06 bacterium]